MFINFITGLPKLKNSKKENNDLILVIVNNLTIMIYYRPIQTAINVAK